MKLTLEQHLTTRCQSLQDVVDRLTLDRQKMFLRYIAYKRLPIEIARVVDGGTDTDLERGQCYLADHGYRVEVYDDGKIEFIQNGRVLDQIEAFQ